MSLRNEHLPGLEENARHWLVVVCLTLSAGLFRLAGLGHRNIVIDEAITLQLVHKWTAIELLTRLPLVQPHFPTYYLLLDGAVSLGPAIPVARFISVIAGVATVPVVYALGTVYDSRTTGTVTALFIALSPWHIELSQMIRMYALLGFVTALSWLFLELFLRDGGRWRWGYLLSAMAMTYVHYIGAVSLVAQLAVAVYRSHRTPSVSNRGFRVAIYAGIGAIPALAWGGLRVLWAMGIAAPQVGPNAQSQPIITGEYPLTAAQFIRLPFKYLAGELVFNRLVFLSILLLVATLAIFYLETTSELTLETGLPLGAWIGLPFLAGVVVSETVVPTLRPRYFVGAIPAIAIAIVICIREIDKAVLRRGLLVGLLLTTVAGGAATYGTPASDWEQADTVMSSFVQESDQVIVIGPLARVQAFHARYLEWNARVVEPRALPLEPTEGSRPVVVVQYRYPRMPSAGEITAAEIGRSGFKQTAWRKVGRIRIYRFVPRER